MFYGINIELCASLHSTNLFYMYGVCRVCLLQLKIKSTFTLNFKLSGKLYFKVDVMQYRALMFAISFYFSSINICIFLEKWFIELETFSELKQNLPYQQKAPYWFTVCREYKQGMAEILSKTNTFVVHSVISINLFIGSFVLVPNTPHHTDIFLSR